MADALANYEKLKKRIPEVLAIQQPFVNKVDLAHKGIWFRLRIGPLMDEGAAEALCQAIKAAKEPYCQAVEAFDLAQRRPGYFGEVALKPLDDGRNMEVLKTFGFVDDQARIWEVPAGSITDGASIPTALWSIIGSPYTGKYLKAAIIHDYFTQTKYRTWPLTHNNFYEAMIASGVDRNTALIMWAAVYRFGPRWAEDESYCSVTCAGGNIFIDMLEITPLYVDAEFQSIRQFISANPTAGLEEVKDFIEKHTYFPGAEASTLETPYPARVRGYVSGGFSDDEDLQEQIKHLQEQGLADEAWAEVSCCRFCGR